MDASLQVDEPPRIQKFRRDMIKAIPRFPNNRETLQHMQQKGFLNLMVDYVSWRSRYVGARPRIVAVGPEALADPRWSSMAEPITTFLEKVRLGSDLTPHLSIMPHTRGYSPAAGKRGATLEERWSDKDFLLNAMDYYHFHLGSRTEEAGHIERTDDVIFASVTRDEFTVIAIFSHEVFEHESSERMRLWKIQQAALVRSVPPGTVVISGDVTTSGHSGRVVRYAQYCWKLIRANEEKLNDPAFIRALYRDVGHEAPSKPKPRWGFFHLDLVIFDEAKPACFVLQQGWN